VDRWRPQTVKHPLVQFGVAAAAEAARALFGERRNDVIGL
jgi:hypothetical protein